MSLLDLLKKPSPVWLQALDISICIGVLIYLFAAGGWQGVSCLRNQGIIQSCVSQLHPESPCNNPPKDIQAAVNANFSSDCVQQAFATCRNPFSTALNIPIPEES